VTPDSKDRAYSSYPRECCYRRRSAQADTARGEKCSERRTESFQRPTSTAHFARAWVLKRESWKAPDEFTRDIGERGTPEGDEDVWQDWIALSK
jgi:hypothetical protein